MAQKAGERTRRVESGPHHERETVSGCTAHIPPQECSQQSVIARVMALLTAVRMILFPRNGDVRSIRFVAGPLPRYIAESYYSEVNVPPLDGERMRDTGVGKIMSTDAFTRAYMHFAGVELPITTARGQARTGRARRWYAEMFWRICCYHILALMTERAEEQAG